MNLKLERAVNIERYADTGMPFAWRSTGKDIAKFRTFPEFQMYVHKARRRLKTAVAFSPNASLLQAANAFLTKELKDAGML